VSVCYGDFVICVCVFSLGGWVFCCQDQCSRLPGKTCVRNDLLCVVKFCSVSHSLMMCLQLASIRIWCCTVRMLCLSSTSCRTNGFSLYLWRESV